jgi:dTDP-4-amino-4,6-dideoxygalactose transaminase
VWHLFVVRHSERDRLQQALTENGIGTLIHYPVPPHLSGAYADAGYSRGAFPVAEEIADSVLSLPMGPHLSRQQAEAVVQALTFASPSTNSARPHRPSSAPEPKAVA